MRKLFVILLVLAMAGLSTASTKPTFVSYNFTETRRTGTDCRQCITQISLIGDEYINYYYREDVYGSITPIVHSVYFQNSYQHKATVKEKTELVRNLLNAKVFDVKSDPDSTSKEYFADLDVRINDREGRFYFNTPPRSPLRKAIHGIMVKFARQAKVDQPTNRAKSTTTSEGDRQPAGQVQLAEVLANPDKYHGKRISVIGFYHGEFEGNSLSVDEKASRTNDFKRSIWRSEPSIFADKAAIKDKNNAWLLVEGVFLRGPTGHMGLWPGEIVRLTRVEPVSRPR